MKASSGTAFSRRTIDSWLRWGVFVGAITTTTPAQAQSTEGRFQLGLESTLVTAERGTIETSSGATLDYSGSNVGITAGYGLMLGYGVSESVVLGVRLSQATQSFKLDSTGTSSEDDTSTFDFLPRIEGLLGSGNPGISLFGTTGYRSTITETTAVISDPALGTLSQRTRLLSSGFAFGAGVGLHGFVGDNVSLDTSLGVLRTTGDSQSGAEKGSSTSTVVMLTVGISAWLGGRSSSAPKESARSTEEDEADETQEVVDREREEDTERPRHTMISALGVLSRNTELKNSAELRLMAHPKKDGDHIFLRFSLLGMPPPDMESWMECAAGNILAGDEVLPLDNVVVDRAGETPGVRARASVRSLIRLVRAKRLAVLEVCADRNHLGDEARGALLEFLLAFKKSAERQGTWRSAATAAVEDQPASSEDADKQAAIDGAAGGAE